MTGGALKIVIVLCTQAEKPPSLTSTRRRMVFVPLRDHVSDVVALAVVLALPPMSQW